jgi:glycosyltransferase involved in cell wall biosynthesis
MKPPRDIVLGGASLVVGIIVPTLGRPQALRPLLQSIATTTAPGAAEVIFVLDHEDPETHAELADAWRQGWKFGRVFADGTFPEKTNAGVRASDHELVLLTADDVTFHPGWLEHALAALAPDIAVVGTNDLTPATADGMHATMPLVRRSYIEAPGAAFGEPDVAFHPGYHHNFCETELCQLAQHRGIYASCPMSIIEHRHPAWGTREEDETDQRGGAANWGDDEILFHERQERWSA